MSEIVTNNDVEAAKKDNPSAKRLASSKCKKDIPNAAMIINVVINATIEMCLRYLSFTTPTTPVSGTINRNPQIAVTSSVRV